jgi:heme exporter protein A
VSDQGSSAASGIIAKGLSCERGGRRVFEGVDFAVAPGAALLLRGPNGSGKTSLLRMIAGFLEPPEGRLTWNGRPFDEVDDEAGDGPARIAFVGHLDAVKRALSVAENLTFWSVLYGGGGVTVNQALDRLGIGHLAELPARFLSAGQRRRLGLARLMVTPAALWLLDEPTVTLDEASVAAVEGLIAEHRDGGGMVMVATHAEMAIPGAEVLTLGAAR